MSGVFFVPIHLDALSLSNHGTFVGPTADFTRLPYFDGKREVNADVAYVSEDVVSRPFQNENLYLKAGVHLHWALPDALTRGRTSADGQTAFPAVPNRWLVVRSMPGKEQKKWIVESDYLYPEGSGHNSGSVNVPKESPKGERQPFQYLGRNMPLDAWSTGELAKAHYLKRLTAIGYGEPAFSAFYPNCHSVFGFHDDDYKGDCPEGLRYDVIGWYSDESNEFLTHSLRQILATPFNSASSSPHERAAQLIAALENQTGWTIALEDLIPWYSDKETELKKFVGKIKTECKTAGVDLPSASSFLQKVESDLKLGIESTSRLKFPSAIVCYASLTFKTEKEPPKASCSIAVGGSGTEALSAFLAQSIDPEHKSTIEDQLEALLLSDHLEHRQLDIGFKFQEARHEKGFTAVAGGSLWTISQETPGRPAPANATDVDAIRDIALPEAIADQLNALNLLQQNYDRSQQRIESQRRQLFSDWYKYMLSAYPPDDSRQNFPDADKVKHYIETKVINPLNREIEATGTLQLQTDHSGCVTGACTVSGDGSLASSLALSINEMLRSLDFDTGPQIQDVLKYKVTPHALELLPNATYPHEPLKALTSEAPRDKKEFLKLIEGKIPTSSDTTVLLRATQAVSFRLKLGPAPRFWRPNEPVVLIAGTGAEPTDRHGQDGCLRKDNLVVCHLMPDADLKNIVNQKNFKVITEKLDGLRNDSASTTFAFNTWDQNPWNPLFLEWEAEVFPAQSLSNLHPTRAGYSARFISDNYAISDNSVDLSFKAGRGRITKAANVYVGSTIITPYARDKFDEELQTFFIEFMEPRLLKEFYDTQPKQDRNETFLLKHFKELRNWYLDHSDVLLQFYQSRTSAAERNSTWLCKNIGRYLEWALKNIDVYATFKTTPQALKNDPALTRKIIDWLKSQIKLKEFYEDLNVPEKEQSDTYLQEHFLSLVNWYQLRIQQNMEMVIMLQAYHNLSNSHYLSQSLGGFNQALLMHKQVMQLPVADPLGFKDNHGFVCEVSDGVGNMNRSGSEPLNDFNPVLSGVMRLNKLRLIDTFGQVLDVTCKKVVTTNLMQTPTNNYLLTLPPRVVQPCRLNLRWLSAADDQQEMNDHPATSPVCGWVLPNHLNNALAIFDKEGLPLGSISPTGWECAPQSSVDRPDQIANPHLRQMVQHLCNQDAQYVNDFITAVDTALENIEPENFAQHQELAVLMGSPLALVRATLEWELQGEPAINQSWEAFRLDLTRRSRDIDDFTSIEFPIRIGEHRQLNDGVVGYWIEKDDDYENHAFYAPQSNPINHAKIVTSAEADTNILLALDAEPKVLSMLIDPRGVVHATSGIVPTKVINIPPDQYAAALRAIHVTFFTGPVLTTTGEINLPLPTEVGYSWSWIERDKSGWPETLKIGTASPEAEFRGQQIVREGWLKLSADPKTNGNDPVRPPASESRSK